MRARLLLLAAVSFALDLHSAQDLPAPDRDPAWAQAHCKPPMTAAETRAFMKRLAQFVFDHHLKKTDSPQRGMIYEYFWVARKGQPDQFVQGEALDTMHDGAWFAAALVNAHRATGDPFYKEFLTKWVLPFYCKMLNHSDTLFSAKRNDAAPGTKPWGKEWALQEGEKGFVPYWWDDSGSVSLERRNRKTPVAFIPCADFLAGKPNPQFQLNGYSHGSSNHMAQDLAVMLQQAWLLLRDSREDADRELAAEVAEAAKNLHECRMRHFNHIPMCCAAFGLTNANDDELKCVPDQSGKDTWKPASHCYRALYDFKPGERRALPGFADDQQYRHYFGVAKVAADVRRRATPAQPSSPPPHVGGYVLPKALAFKTIYDAFTEPMLYRCYSDDADVPPGINKFDLHPMNLRDGRLEDYRSDRKGPFKGPRPIGSRMGPQNMICCGWALQALRAYPGIWEERYRSEFSDDLRVYSDDWPITGRPLDEMTPLPVAQLGGVTLHLISDRTKLRIDGECTNNEVMIKVFSRPDAQGSHAVITLNKNGAATATNDKGQPLRLQSRVTSHESRFTFYVSLPYTIRKDQFAPWANGVEHGRYSIQVGDATRNFYLASSEPQVKVWLERELAGGLRTWEAIFNKYGYIPTGIGAGDSGIGTPWDSFSDSGGYAHLLSAAAQWLMYLEGKEDWKLHLSVLAQ